MRRRLKPPAASAAAAAPLPASGARRGRVTLRQRIARRHLVRVLSRPAYVPVVALGVVVVFAAIAAGTLLALAVGMTEAGGVDL